MKSFIAMLGVVLTAAAPSLHGAALRVVSGGAAQQVLQTLVPTFESATGHTVDLSFAVVGAIQQKLAAGEKADVLLLPAPLLDTLEKAGTFRAGSRTALGRVPIGVVVREGAKIPDISTPEAVRTLLLESRSIAFPDPQQTPSGSHLMRVLAQMGIAGEMQPRITFRNAIDGGVNLVRDGQVEIGLFLVTEALPVKGIRLVGILPATLQGYVAYAAAVAADSAQTQAASELVKFLADPDLRAHWTRAGFEPPGGGR
jgi:molybdate transport system substrate-binding protein